VRENPDSNTAEASFCGNAILLAISAIYNISTAVTSARNYNRKHGLGQISVAPVLDLKKGTPGKQLSMPF
jgi:hypothetical protein